MNKKEICKKCDCKIGEEVELEGKEELKDILSTISVMLGLLVNNASNYSERLVELGFDLSIKINKYLE